VRGEIAYAMGDRVMQIRNNMTGRFQWDIGYIVDVIDNSDAWSILTDKKIHYEQKDSTNWSTPIASAYTESGCEFKAVIVIMMTQHYILLQRNLLYTAITRAVICASSSGPQKPSASRCQK